MSIAERIAAIRLEMEAAARAAGRDPRDILLLAATKCNSSQAVREAIAAGVDCCGENRVQELTQKLSEHVYEGAPVHFIGHLQTNKVRHVVGKVDLIQSVDSRRLLKAIDAQASKLGILQDILLELHLGGEESKSGFAPEEVLPLLEKIGEFPNIRVKGLMAIPPISENPGDNRVYFEKIYQLSVDIIEKKYDNVTVECLSMGMSGDFADAIACGSTMLRLGTAIFGPRNHAEIHPKGCDLQEDLQI